MFKPYNKIRWNSFIKVSLSNTLSPSSKSFKKTFLKNLFLNLQYFLQFIFSWHPSVAALEFVFLSALILLSTSLWQSGKSLTNLTHWLNGLHIFVPPEGESRFSVWLWIIIIWSPPPPPHTHSPQLHPVFCWCVGQVFLLFFFFLIWWIKWRLSDFESSENVLLLFWELCQKFPVHSTTGTHLQPPPPFCSSFWLKQSIRETDQCFLLACCISPFDEVIMIKDSWSGKEAERLLLLQMVFMF